MKFNILITSQNHLVLKFVLQLNPAFITTVRIRTVAVSVANTLQNLCILLNCRLKSAVLMNFKIYTCIFNI